MHTSSVARKLRAPLGCRMQRSCVAERSCVARKLRALLGCRMQRSCVERNCKEKLQLQRVATASCGPSRAGPVGGPRLYLGHFLPSVLRPTPPPAPPALLAPSRPPPVMSSRDFVRQSVHENCCKRRDILSKKRSVAVWDTFCNSF